MRNCQKKRLIQYGQFLSIQKSSEPAPSIPKTMFLRAMKGDEDAILDVTPECVKWLTGEYASLGETLLKQTMETFAVMS